MVLSAVLEDDNDNSPETVETKVQHEH